ncbi:hypothetical protein [Stenotrophomonas sp. YIM B06876]|uniref:hypothetical protein n=1 Tax=Stenotrophomonas sp. YIM B06876 TaxID=3060211 RepID=UPI002738D069|nr:hypothetical protein [Stenotrophomonas sp. YIM B06876]
MNDPDNPRALPTRPPLSQLGAITWPSFFAAAVAAAVFFTFVDPLQLCEISFPEHRISRELGYAAGFFLLWLATFSTSTVTWLLLRPPTDAGMPLE